MVFWFPFVRYFLVATFGLVKVATLDLAFYSKIFAQIVG